MYQELQGGVHGDMQARGRENQYYSADLRTNFPGFGCNTLTLLLFETRSLVPIAPWLHISPFSS